MRAAMAVLHILLSVCLGVGASAYGPANLKQFIGGNTRVVAAEGTNLYDGGTRVVAQETPWHQGGAGPDSSNTQVVTSKATWHQEGANLYDGGTRVEIPVGLWPQGWSGPDSSRTQVTTSKTTWRQGGANLHDGGTRAPEFPWHQNEASLHHDSTQVNIPEAPWPQGGAGPDSSRTQVITSKATWHQEGANQYDDGTRVVAPESLWHQNVASLNHGRTRVEIPEVLWPQGGIGPDSSRTQVVTSKTTWHQEGAGLYNGDSHIGTPEHTWNQEGAGPYGSNFRVVTPEMLWTDGGTRKYSVSSRVITKETLLPPGGTSSRIVMPENPDRNSTQMMPEGDDPRLPSTGYSAGTRVEPREAPWHAGIYEKFTRPYRQICGGTVIAKNVVLTAAHCFTRERKTPSPSNYAVAAGKIYRPWDDPNDKEAQKSDVVAIHIPPRYQGNKANFQEDIAIVVLSKEFVFGQNVRQACLHFEPGFDNEQLREGELGKVVGWGLTGANTQASQVLQGGKLPSITIDRCIEDSPEWFKSYITADKICAGYKNGTAVCRGDSGGGIIFPLTVEGFTRFYLRGLVSTSPTTENNACNIYTWATFTHVLRQEHFIKSVVPNIEQSCIEYDEKDIMRTVLT